MVRYGRCLQFSSVLDIQLTCEVRAGETIVELRYDCVEEFRNVGYQKIPPAAWDKTSAADDEEELRVDEDGKLHGCIHRLAQGGLLSLLCHSQQSVKTSLQSLMAPLAPLARWLCVRRLQRFSSSPLPVCWDCDGGTFVVSDESGIFHRHCVSAYLACLPACLTAWMDGRTDRRTDGWMDGWMDVYARFWVLANTLKIPRFDRRCLEQ
ncbi:hypothetical protein AK812_SmicGene14991 [Symbiodinium microadriaticum]|uniref:Uncharacterized protein n=1 Tax=Symbiodinium microadriaticum TaxID=2951 RepID=A0A1Q9E450_SYMMI|nr:hypothetical protein AK812_SmicGene14991 [Symbiodinium microadriaticum]